MRSKAYTGKLRFVEEPVPVHLCQARCYAAIYAEQNQLEQMEVQMTYCNMETEEIRRFSYMFDAQELKHGFRNLPIPTISGTLAPGMGKK